MLKKKRDRKFSGCLWILGLATAVLVYCRYLDHLTHVRTPAKVRHIVSSAVAPAAGKAELAASPPKPDDKPVLVITTNQVPVKAAPVSFADSLMSVLTPSAEAVTFQPEMPPARKPVKPVAVPTKAGGVSVQKPQPLTAGQKRWQLAQDGFGVVINLAYQYPDAYGFMPGENLRDVRLGDPIPVYSIPQPGRGTYVGQPLQSLLKPADEWMFPIILENRIRFMVQIRCVGHDYVLGHGSRALAMVYDKILARWPASEGYHPQLVILPNLPGYYFTIPELPGQNITDTGRILDCIPELSPAAVILAGWR